MILGKLLAVYYPWVILDTILIQEHYVFNSLNPDKNNTKLTFAEHVPNIPETP